MLLKPLQEDVKEIEETNEIKEDMSAARSDQERLATVCICTSMHSSI